MNETQPAVQVDSIQAYFASELRRLRLLRGLTQEQLSTRICYSTGLISMIETGRRLPNRDLAGRCDKALEAGGALERLWPLVNREAYPTWFRSFVEFEAQATSILEFEAQTIPGLLQTEAYARALLASMWPPHGEDEVEQRLAGRLNRQQILDRKKPPLLWVVMDESVLRRTVSDRAMAAEQLQHLIEMAHRPSIRIQVLPFTVGIHAAMDGSFFVLDMPDGDRIAYVEGPGRGRLLTEPHEVADCGRRFDALCAAALSPEDSIGLIKRTLGEL